MRLIDKDALEDAVQGAINVMESHGISMIAASVPLAIIKGAPTIDAIPMWWITEKFLDVLNKDKELSKAVWLVRKAWQKEQEAHGT